MRHDMAGGKARWKPFKVGKEVHTALSLLEIGVHEEIGVHWGLVFTVGLMFTGD